MAKFIINSGYAGEESIEAKEYTQASGFFWFYSDSGDLVLTYAQEKTTSIRRLDS